MLYQLRTTNPASKWLREKFWTTLMLANGHQITLWFDLASCGKEGYKWDADKVITRLDPTFLVDKETEFGEYLSLASTVADVLNQRMDIISKDVMGHARESLRILEAISAENKTVAYLKTVALASRLVAYGSIANTIWGDWIAKVAEFTKPQNPPNTLGINVIL